MFKRLLHFLQRILGRKKSTALIVAACRSAVPGTPECEKLDSLQARMLQCPQVECPIVHRFTPGLYAREITVPAGTMVMTKIHLTEHPFVISKGSVSVWTDGGGIQRLAAPYTGITKPGTRRLCFAHTDLVWTTFHPTQETDVDKIEAQIILPHDEDVARLEEGRMALLADVADAHLLLTSPDVLGFSINKSTST